MSIENLNHSLQAVFCGCSLQKHNVELSERRNIIKINKNIVGAAFSSTCPLVLCFSVTDPVP